MPRQCIRGGLRTNAASSLIDEQRSYEIIAFEYMVPGLCILPEHRGTVCIQQGKRKILE